MATRQQCKNGHRSLRAHDRRATGPDPRLGFSDRPCVAAALCVKPRGLLTADQAAKVDALKKASRDFAVMRTLAMRFQGNLRSKDVSKLEDWLDDAFETGIYAMQRFVRTLNRDLEAVRNAVEQPWSNGQIEGQVNRLKTLKRAMYGRVGAELLRARMLPFHPPNRHTL
ncbi:transposase [Phyllobacterium sp. LjRoot231]|uniref:transposase n=1 Tax=Phyllobacterium sp. LjRoot231 TaxID=3342289 RepID=UPI003F4F486B